MQDIKEVVIYDEEDKLQQIARGITIGNIRRVGVDNSLQMRKHSSLRDDNGIPKYCHNSRAECVIL